MIRIFLKIILKYHCHTSLTAIITKLYGFAVIKGVIRTEFPLLPREGVEKQQRSSTNQ
ncbi:MAG: hypothetical protein ACXWFZ_07170 [Nitrososphaeraceae archaeon]